ncbi:MAG: MFS transporter [Desulfobacterales bacterium]|jgi:MFS family permease|nr:MFS transporter [Desulfobacterales bacterium]
MLAVQALVSMSAVAIPVLMPVAAADLNVPPSFVGIFMSLIYLSATLIAPVSGYFVDRIGPIGVSQICLGLCAAGLTLISIPWVSMMLAGTLIMGVGYGPVTPASSHLLVRTTPAAMMSVVFSIKQTGVPVGGAMAGAIVPLLVVLCGWKMSALWVAAFSLVLMGVLQPYRRRFDSARRTGAYRFSWKHLVEPVRMVLRHHELRELAIASFFFSAMQLCLISFLVAYVIEDFSLTLIQAGLLLSIAQVSGVIGRVAWGALADRSRRPRAVLGLLGIGMAAGALATAAISPGWPYAAVMVTCALFGAAAIGWNGVYLAEVARIATPEHAGTATGGTLFFTFCGILTGLPAFSLLVQQTGSYPLIFGVIALATLFCGVALLAPRSSR